jgi:hypothetical protein
MRFFVYKTTCLVNQKYYIGVHREVRASDGYIGCGVCSQGTAVALKKKGIKSILIDSVLKYGYKNFKREIVKEFDNEIDAYKYEEEILTPELIKDKNCLNIKTGGNGGRNLNICKKVSIINTITGEILDFESQSDCAGFLGLKNISGKKSFLKNKYLIKGTEKPVSLKRIDGKIFYFFDVSQAAKITNNNVNRINDLIKRNRSHSNGWFLSDFDFLKEKNYRHAKKIRKEIKLVN